MRTFANPDLPRPPPRRRPPVQPPLVLPVPPPDARRLDDGDMRAALHAALVDVAAGELTYGALAALVAMWDGADVYGVYPRSASALATALGSSKSRGRDFARSLSDRSHIARRPDGSVTLRTARSDGVSGPKRGAPQNGPEPGPKRAGTRSKTGRDPHPLRGGGGRRASSQTTPPPDPKSPLKPKPPRPELEPAPPLEAWAGPNDAGRAELAAIKRRRGYL